MEGLKNFNRQFLGIIICDIYEFCDLGLKDFVDNYELLKLLIDSKVDIYPDGDETLRLACENGYTSVVQLLIDAKIDVHSNNEILKVASRKEHTSIVKLLIDAKAGIKLPEGAESGNQSFHSALHDFSNLILKGMKSVNSLDIEEISHKNTNELISASSKGQLLLAKLLIHKGNNTHVYDKAMIIASKNGHFSIVQLLIDAKANVNANKYAAITRACENGHFSIVKLLIDAKANMEHNNTFLPLMIASSNGHTAIVQLLINAKSDIHELNEYSFKKACENGHTAVVQLLINEKADIHADKDKALSLAYKNGHAAIVQMLLNANN